MFHNLLVAQGVVLDLDYRASEGYGRDWRTAIYRWMGKPELEDYLDGIDWAVANRQVDRDRVGIYGGSYGGFMTFVAVQAPGTFKAGAALRPVSDWSQYNHEYTSNILNTPGSTRGLRALLADRVPQGLQDHLLTSPIGMIDDNVFFKDSVMLAQKLIDAAQGQWGTRAIPGCWMASHGFPSRTCVVRIRIPPHHELFWNRR